MLWNRNDGGRVERREREREMGLGRNRLRHAFLISTPVPNRVRKEVPFLHFFRISKIGSRMGSR